MNKPRDAERRSSPALVSSRWRTSRLSLFRPGPLAELSWEARKITVDDKKRKRRATIHLSTIYSVEVRRIGELAENWSQFQGSDIFATEIRSENNEESRQWSRLRDALTSDWGFAALPTGSNAKWFCPRLDPNNHWSLSTRQVQWISSVRPSVHPTF